MTPASSQWLDVCPFPVDTMSWKAERWSAFIACHIAIKPLTAYAHVPLESASTLPQDIKRSSSKIINLLFIVISCHSVI